MTEQMPYPTAVWQGLLVDALQNAKHDRDVKALVWMLTAYHRGQYILFVESHRYMWE